MRKQKPSWFIIAVLLILVASAAIVFFTLGKKKYSPTILNPGKVLELLQDKEFRIREQKAPFEFRMLENVRISGSSQFSKVSLQEIVKKIRQHNQATITVIDVRQEMHLLGDSHLAETIAEKDWSEINHKLESIIKDEENLVQSGLLEREETVANNLDLKYLRVLVTDDSIPSDQAVDSFLEFYKERIQGDPQTWFHVHCEHGHGRTTTFMALVHILNTKGEAKLGDILAEQHQCGGAYLAIPPKDSKKIKDFDLQRLRFAFLTEFHQYVNDKDSGFFAGKSWSSWKKAVRE